MVVAEKLTFPLRKRVHEHDPSWGTGPVQKSQRERCRLAALACEIYLENLVLLEHQLTSAQFDVSAHAVVGELLSIQDEVDQIVARAKYRPESGVTVIGVPKTAET